MAYFSKMFLPFMKNAFHIWLIFNILLQCCTGWLWWSPASEIDTYKKCKEMKEKDDPWYPTYCDSLITKHDEKPIDVNFASADAQSYSSATDTQGTTRSPDATKRLPDVIIGWGWSEWGEWGDGGCPEICGRRCNRRSRYCTGPYHLICKGRGSIQDYDDCEELENNGNNGFERKSTISDFENSKASGIINMITQMQQQQNDEPGGSNELPDYESSLQNLMRLDQTLQKLDGLLGKDMVPKYRDRFVKKRLIKFTGQKNDSAIRAISKPIDDIEADSIS